MCSDLQFATLWHPLKLELTFEKSIICTTRIYWCTSCTSSGARKMGDFSGAQVTTLFGSSEVQPKSKHGMLPILTALFLISYGLMTLLIVEQGSTIQSQRTLIQQLLGDSTALAVMKGKAIQQAQAPKPSADAHASAPVQAPSTQTVPSEKTSTAKNHKAQRPLPEKPPVPASDIADARRTLMSI
jgi:hypothetical protein